MRILISTFLMKPGKPENYITSLKMQLYRMEKPNATVIQSCETPIPFPLIFQFQGNDKLINFLFIFSNE